ncbi:unnamed protein product [Parascedosporium putredinis]|uniref:Aminoacyl-transfer RNA synthetases class-II family profile domain-containing protein n=1 Tax=Parascedosporium putredinis TaxID=1442378 RepID=A0A9P1MAC7_9PEZI|nr:unnamed protein product [Parascedosporium putredinis]CAI7993880.1 unnamed protein product [Parascedosporium putredinis]
MASTNSKLNGNHASSSPDGALDSVDEGTNLVVLDARVHSLPVIGPDALITILVRHRGKFTHALLEPGLVDSASLDAARQVTAESLVRISGVETTSDESKRNDEFIPTLRVANFLVISAAKSSIPAYRQWHRAPGDTPPEKEKRDALIDERLDNRLLDARVASTAAIFKIFSGIHELAVAFLADRDFIHIPTPSLIGYGFPGEDDDLFSLPYFDEVARLAPTGEIHLGMALSADLERVYDIHPVFRREPASDGRHLTEFTMLELVFNLKNSWIEILELANDLIISIIRSLQEHEKKKQLLEEEDDDTSQSFDVILRGQEVVTGCRLLHAHEDLCLAYATRAHPIDPESKEWRPYMFAHEIGMPPWGGFGSQQPNLWPQNSATVSLGFHFQKLARDITLYSDRTTRPNLPTIVRTVSKCRSDHDGKVSTPANIHVSQNTRVYAPRPLLKVSQHLA